MNQAVSSAQPPQPTPPITPPASPSKPWPKPLLVSLLITALAGVAYFGYTKLKPQSKPLSSPSPSPQPAADQQLDSDSDSLPDQLELAVGFNPYIPQDQVCKNQACQTPSPQPDQPQLNTIIILDASGSMDQTINKEVKMAVAKQTLTEQISLLPQDSNIGLIVYGHKGDNTKADKELSCSGIDLIYPLGSPNTAAFTKALDPIQPSGWTAIGGALEKAKTVLSKHPKDQNQILIISDGLETCHTDPVAKAKDLKTANLVTKIDVIGFDVNQGGANILKQISDAGGGQYQTASTAQQLKTFQTDFLKTTDSACLNYNPTAHLNCITSQYNQANDYLLKQYLNLNLDLDQALTLSQIVLNHRDQIINRLNQNQTTPTQL